MKDTSDTIDKKFRNMLLERSGEERLKMGCSMYSTARALVRASVLAKNPLASRAAVRKALFLRFYGDEFSPSRRKKILRELEKNLAEYRKAQCLEVPVKGEGWHAIE